MNEIKQVLFHQLSNFGEIDIQAISTNQLRVSIKGSSQSQQKALLFLNATYAKEEVFFELVSSKTPFVVADHTAIEINIIDTSGKKHREQARFDFERLNDLNFCKEIKVTDDPSVWKEWGIDKVPACFSLVSETNTNSVDYYFNAYALPLIEHQLSEGWRIPNLIDIQAFNTIEMVQARRLSAPQHSIERFGTITSKGFFNYIWLNETQGMKHQLYGISVFGMPKMHYKHAEKLIGLPLLIIKNISYE